MTHIMYGQQYDTVINLTLKAKPRFKGGSMRMPIRIYYSQSDYFSTLYFDSDFFLSLGFFVF